MILHFTGGDMFDSTLEPGWAPFTVSGLAQRGPPASPRGDPNNPNYLQRGDIMELSVATDDGAVDLGTYRTAVRYA